MKRMIWLVVGGLMIISLCGCVTTGTIRYPRVRVKTNLPIHLYRDLTVVVVNTSGFQVKLIIDGKLKAELQSGKSITIFFNNYTTRSARVCLTAIAYKGDKVIGATARKFNVSGYYKDSTSWILRNKDFR